MNDLEGLSRVSTVGPGSMTFRDHATCQNANGMFDLAIGAEVVVADRGNDCSSEAP